jgi:hypothetical protein
MADAFEPLLAAASNTTSAITAPILEELGNEVDLATCRLLGPFALAIQGIMGAAVLGSLVVKRMREKPRRKWKIWLADVSKQVIGQAFVHASNVAISDLIAMHTSDNPCSLYALNIITDTTLGVLILYWLLQLSTRLMRQYAQPLYETGYYGSPFSLSLWGEQAAVYVACLTAMKVVVLILFWLFPFLEDVMSWTLSWITNEEAQVFVVMLVIPLFMNLFQFLMSMAACPLDLVISNASPADTHCAHPVDSFLKSKETHSPVIGADTDEEAQRRGFLEDEGEEDGDESLDDRNMREIRRKSGSEDGEDREYSGLGGNDDDDDDKYRKRERPQARQRDAVNLFDADLEGDDSFGDASGPRTQPSLHSYPPPHPTPSAAPAQPMNPPPYSSNAAPTSDVEEDAWDEDWSGSEATRSRPPSPTPALSPAPPPSTDSPAAAVFEGITTKASTTPPVATTTGLLEETTPAIPPALVSGGVHEILGEGGVEDDWGFGHEEDAEEAESAKSMRPALSSSPAAAPVDENGSAHPPSPAAQISAIPPSLAYAPSPAPDADDWGLDLEEDVEHVDAQEPTSASVSEALSAAHESAVEEGSAADRSVEKIDGGGHSDPPAHASDEDEWGFQEEHEDAVTESVKPMPSEEVPLPDTGLATETGVDTTPVDSSVDATTGDVVSSEQISAATEEDDLDDWGFHDSPSLTQDADGQDELKNDLSRIAQGRPESAKSDAQPSSPSSLL